MTAPWRKVLRDLWQARARTTLVVAAITMGLAGFFAVLSTYAVLTRELNDAYLATNPASATLKTDAVDEALLAAVASNPDVRIAEARRTIAGRVRAHDGGWRSLVLFVVKDFGDIRLSTLKRETGAWPPRAGEILIERDALQVGGFHIGDLATVQTAKGRDYGLRVSGSVHDVGQAQARMENIVYGYITLETLSRLGETPYLDQLKILVAGDPFNENRIRRIAGDVRKIVEEHGHAVSRVDVPRPGKHPHADIMGLLLLAMSIFGFFVVVLSGVLIVNLMAALMASQVRQIGVMKALGATRGQIARIYLGSSSVLGGAAIAAAIPAGLLGSRALCRSMAVFLNFDIVSFAAPAWVYLSVAAIGLVVPLLASAYPIWTGSGISVRDALDDLGSFRNTFGTSGFDRAVARFGVLTRPVLLAVRNSLRKRARLALTLATLATGGVFFMSALNIRASMIHTIDRLLASKRFDLSISLAAMTPVERVERAIHATGGVRRSECWIASEGVMAGDRFGVVAVPPKTDFLDPNIVAGRNLNVGDTDAIVVNSALAAKEPGMQVGRIAVFRMGPEETSWRVVGISREPFSPPAAYIPRSFFERWHPGMTNLAHLQLDRTDPASIGRVKEALDRNLAMQNVRPLSISSKADRRIGFDQHMVMIYVFLIVVSGIIGGVGGLGLATTMSINVLERRREMGVLRAIGASGAAISSIVIAEGCATGVLAWAIAAIVAWPVSRSVGAVLFGVMLRTDLDYSVEPLGILVWLLFCVVVGAMASLLPAFSASRRTVREALAYE